MTRRKSEEETPMLDLVAQLAAAPGSDAEKSTQEADVPQSGHLDETASTDGDAQPASTAAMEGAVDALMMEAGATQGESGSFEDKTIDEVSSGHEDENTPDVSDAGSDSDEKTSLPLAASAPEAGRSAATQSTDIPPVETKAGDAADDVSSPIVDETAVRIFLRQQVLEIAAELDAGNIGRRTAARRLREMSEDDARALDADDIEVDFDAAPEDHAGMSLLAGLGLPKGERRPVDPVEAALLAAIKLRDRVSALRIVGDAPGGVDRTAYRDALRALRDALNTHLED